MLEAVTTDLVSPSAWSAAPKIFSYPQQRRPITPSIRSPRRHAPTAERCLGAVPDRRIICLLNCSRRSSAAPHHAPVRGSCLADRYQLVTDVSVLCGRIVR